MTQDPQKALDAFRRCLQATTPLKPRLQLLAPLLALVLSRQTTLTEADAAWLVPLTQTLSHPKVLGQMVAKSRPDSPHLPALCSRAAGVLQNTADRSFVHAAWLDHLVASSQASAALAMLEAVFAGKEPFLQLESARKFHHYYLLYLTGERLSPARLRLGLAAGADARRRWPDYNIRHNYGVLCLSNGLYHDATTMLLEAARHNLQRWPALRRPDVCAEWRVFEWSNSSNASWPAGAAPGAVSSKPPRLEVILPAEEAFFGAQETPFVASPVGSLSSTMPWLCPPTSTKCNLFPMAHPGQDVVMATLSDAWVEGIAGANDVVVVHAGCDFHLPSKQHTRGVSPPSTDSLAAKNVVAVERAALLHWNTRNYYHFVAESLCKMLVLRDLGAFGGADKPTASLGDLEVLLVHQPWVEEYVSLLGIPPNVIRYIDPPATSYNIQHLVVVDFALPPSAGVPPDRLSTSPPGLLRRLREVGVPLALFLPYPGQRCPFSSCLSRPRAHPRGIPLGSSALLGRQLTLDVPCRR